MASESEGSSIAYKQQGLRADSEWPIDEMPAMPLDTGIAIVRVAAREASVSRGDLDTAILMQHRLAVQEADNKWQIQQSALKTEAANRFRTRAKGWAALITAAGGGAVVTLVVEHLLLT